MLTVCVLLTGLTIHAILHRKWIKHFSLQKNVELSSDNSDSNSVSLYTCNSIYVYTVYIVFINQFRFMHFALSKVLLRLMTRTNPTTILMFFFVFVFLFIIWKFKLLSWLYKLENKETLLNETRNDLKHSASMKNCKRTSVWRAAILLCLHVYIVLSSLSVFSHWTPSNYKVRFATTFVPSSFATLTNVYATLYLAKLWSWQYPG